MARKRADLCHIFKSVLCQIVSASEKKLAAFHDDEIANSASNTSVVICKVEADRFVSGAMRGMCELAVLEMINERKGLAFLLELRYVSGACPAAVVSVVYKLLRTDTAGSEGCAQRGAVEGPAIVLQSS